AQNHLFDILNEPVKAMDVRKIRNLSNHKAKQYYDHLEELGYIEVIGRNPKTHKLTEMIISNID
ncbi:hypothetical protein, partial [Alkalibacterium sp. 20]|uniref:hypothetical protein n=1 Tax=Alkalibacterium sp. 20 TaxID=1798803 RepID=UPI000AC57621